MKELHMSMLQFSTSYLLIRIASYAILIKINSFDIIQLFLAKVQGLAYGTNQLV